jgi:hypothetical protein
MGQRVAATPRRLRARVQAVLHRGRRDERGVDARVERGVDVRFHGQDVVGLYKLNPVYP